MTERDVRFAATLDDALAALDRAASALGGSFVLTEFAADFRSGHVEAGGRARLYVVILEDAPDIVVRVDTSDSLGLRLADRLASEPDAI
jgi:hypothetical protein